MKQSLITLAALFLFSAALPGFTACGSDEDGPLPDPTSEPGKGRCLVVYFSLTGNTRAVATEIHGRMGGTLVEVVPAESYPSDYEATLTKTQEEIRAIDEQDLYPGIETALNDMDDYDVMIICTPLWHARMATPVQAFLHNHASMLEGKKVALAVTSSSTEIASVVSDARRLCGSDALVGDALWVMNSQTGQISGMVARWLETLDWTDDQPEQPEDNAPATVEAVDLGLSVQWASHNLGATAAEGFGGYYGWADPMGESITSHVYDELGNWLPGLYGGPDPLPSIVGTEYDIVRAKWGGTWRLPTYEEMKELESCPSEWITINGVSGLRFTGPNGNRLFFPAAGSRLDETISYEGTVGYYWTGSLSTDPQHRMERAYRLYMGQDRTNTNPAYRYHGQSIRPVSDAGPIREEPDRIRVIIGEQELTATLEANATSQAFASLLPLRITMKELNGNEKYHYLSDALPASPTEIGTIHAGDVMLYGNDCIVLFYKTFTTSYRYTRIGRLEDTSNLESIVGRGNIAVFMTEARSAHTTRR